MRRDPAGHGHLSANPLGVTEKILLMLDHRSHAMLSTLSVHCVPPLLGYGTGVRVQSNSEANLMFANLLSEDVVRPNIELAYPQTGGGDDDSMEVVVDGMIVL